MLKKFSKFLVLILVMFIISSSSFICLADEPEENSNILTTTQTNEEITTEDPVHYGDLFLFDNNIVMDQQVDGNVFIFGNNIEITGIINGNLFVFANTLTLSNECIVRYSIFICANSVYYDGGSYNGSLYVAANNVEMTYNSYVAKDVKAIAKNIIFKSAIGRDADLICNNLDLGEGSNIPLIYGNLRYSAKNEIEIPEGAITSPNSVTYTKHSQLNSSSIIDILTSFLTIIVTVSVIYCIISKYTPNFAQKLSSQKLSVLKLFKAFGIGLLSMITFVVIFTLLLLSSIGVDLAILLLAIYSVISLISVPILIIIITNILKPILKIEKTPMFYLILILVTIILQGLTLITFIGEFLGLIIFATALGLFISMYLPHKELTDEEKLALEETKKQAKENKEKRKQEKLEAKIAKKEEQNKIKNDKKAEKKKSKEN